MKLFVIFLLFSSCFDLSASTSAKDLHNFKVRDLLKDKEQMTQIVGSSFESINLSNRSEASNLIKKAVRNLPVEKHIINNEIYSEFLYQLSLQPSALVSLLQIFTKPYVFLHFFIFVFATMIVGHWMGELKFSMKMMSFYRLGYGLFRFSCIGLLQFIGLIVCFKPYFAELGGVYLVSLGNIADTYPRLLTLSHFFANILDFSSSF